MSHVPTLRSAAHYAVLSYESASVARQANAQLLSAGKDQVLIQELPRLIVVAVRGTELSIGEWVRNAFAFPRAEIMGAKCHAGFNRAAQSLEHVLRIWLRDKDQSKPILLIGHSLGGAVSQILAPLLIVDHPIAGVVSFGSPRVWNSDYEPVCRHTRVVSAGDTVTQVPLPFGFTHHESELIEIGEGWTPFQSDHVMRAYLRRLEPLRRTDGPSIADEETGP